MAKRIVGTTPRQDGYRMPGEFEEQTGVWMLWPQRPDNWRGGAKPAQQAFADVARAIARFEPVTVCVNPDQFQNARARLPEDIRVVEMTSNDAWVRDCGPTFVKNDQGGLRAVDWTFNAWGGLHDGLYFPWDQDDLVARKICELEGVDSYRTDGFVLEGGSIHVDGQGTVLTTEMCLLGAAIQAVSPDSSLFWSFFALNLVMLLLSYMPVFPAFLALRRKYPQAERPFRVPGGPGMLRVLAYVPMVLIGLSILFTAVPLSTDRETLATILPITVGSVISVLLGELLIAVRRHHQPRSGG